jgi:hypothetical protein
VAGWLALLLLLTIPGLAAVAAAPTEASRPAAENASGSLLNLRGASAFGPGASRTSYSSRYILDFTRLTQPTTTYAGALPFNNCTPLSTLSCTDLVVNTATPFVLNFNGTEGGLADRAGLGTGFRMVDRPSARLAVDGAVSNAAVPGYEPSRLQVVNGRLNITANRGIAFLTLTQSLARQFAAQCPGRRRGRQCPQAVG